MCVRWRRQMSALIRALAREHCWKRMLEEGRYSSAEIAEAEKIGWSFVNRLLRLILLAPDIQETIPEERQPKGTMRDARVRLVLSKWAEQCKMFRFSEAAD